MWVNEDTISDQNSCIFYLIMPYWVKIDEFPQIITCAESVLTNYYSNKLLILHLTILTNIHISCGHIRLAVHICLFKQDIKQGSYSIRYLQLEVLSRALTPA